MCCDCERCLRQQLAAIRLLTDWSCSCPCRPGCARRHSLSSGVGFCHGRPTDARNKAVTVLGSIYRQRPACVCAAGRNYATTNIVRAWAYWVCGLSLTLFLI